MSYITLGQLKEFVGNKLQLVKGDSFIIEKRKMYGDSDKLPYNALCGKMPLFFNAFANGKDPRWGCDGLYVEKVYENETSYVDTDDISIMYNKLIQVNVEKDVYEAKPCGEKLDIFGSAVIQTIKQMYGGDEEVVDTMEIKGSLLLLIDKNIDWLNNLGSNLNSKTLVVGANETNEDRETLVKAIYYYRGQKAETFFTIKQRKNVISEWKKGEEKTYSISLEVNKDTISKDGGEVDMKVTKYFSIDFYKEDSCGNIISSKTVSGNTKEITTLCSFSLSNTNGFKRIHDSIFVDKQEVNAPKRSTTITALYNGLTSKQVIEQEKGEVMNTRTILLFKENSLGTLTRPLVSAQEQIFTVPYVATSTIYAGLENLSTSPIKDLTLSTNEKWLKASIDCRNSQIIVSVDKNKDLEKNRQGCIVLKENVGSKEITLNVIQNNNQITSMSYELEVEGRLYYAHDEMDSSQLIVKPTTIISYSDGSQMREEGLKGDVSLCVKGYSENNDVISVGELTENENNYIYKPIVKGGSSLSDVNLVTEFVVVNDNTLEEEDKVTKIITIEREKITNYSYNFSFDDGEIEKTLIWTNSTLSKSKKIGVTSQKLTYYDGIFSSSITHGFKYYALDGDYSQFKVLCENGVVTFIPTIQAIKNDTTKKYVFFQNDTQKQLVLNLLFSTQGNVKNIELRTILKQSNSLDDAWTNDGAYVEIKNLRTNNISKVNLSKGWVNGSEQITSDVLCSSSLSLIVGDTYEFRTVGLEILRNSSELDEKNYNTTFTKTIDTNVDLVELIINI